LETHRSASVEQTLSLGAELARRLPGGSVLLLEGELGAGKTHFVKGLAMGLGLDPDEVVSPTFTMVQVHENAGGIGLVHADLYRLSDASELPELGLDELPGAERIAAVEWPERLHGSESAGCWRVRLVETGETARELVFAPPPPDTPAPGRVT
jgi:tRNA threonylcarbamoyladenosine biosynthesis protein TsaE